MSDWALTLGFIERVEAHADTNNAGSIRTLLASGFEQEGVLRNYFKFGDVVSDAAVLSKIRV